mmetsp:Transcript_36892/g.102409  ORF Transcript_36892/g.102409 Transcript_36892/m.102409 type:complete len:216 (-) Transcript_36892:110-757(-)
MRPRPRRHPPGLCLRPHCLRGRAAPRHRGRGHCSWLQRHGVLGALGALGTLGPPGALGTPGATGPRRTDRRRWAPISVPQPSLAAQPEHSTRPRRLTPRTCMNRPWTTRVLPLISAPQSSSKMQPQRFTPECCLTQSTSTIRFPLLSAPIAALRTSWTPHLQGSTCQCCPTRSTSTTRQCCPIRSTSTILHQRRGALPCLKRCPASVHHAKSWSG